MLLVSMSSGTVLKGLRFAEGCGKSFCGKLNEGNFHSSRALHSELRFSLLFP